MFNLAQGRYSPNNIRYTPPTSRTLKELSNADLENKICRVQNELVEETHASQVLLEHLFASFQIMSRKHKMLKVELTMGYYPALAFLDLNVT